MHRLGLGNSLSRRGSAPKAAIVDLVTHNGIAVTHNGIFVTHSGIGRWSIATDSGFGIFTVS